LGAARIEKIIPKFPFDADSQSGILGLHGVECNQWLHICVSVFLAPETALIMMAITGVIMTIIIAGGVIMIITGNAGRRVVVSSATRSSGGVHRLRGKMQLHILQKQLLDSVCRQRRLRCVEGMEKPVAELLESVEFSSIDSSCCWIEN